MSKALSKKTKPKERMWELIKDVDKGIIGFYREGIPYFITSIPEWSYMLSHPIIRGEPENVEQTNALEIDSGDYIAGHA